MNILERFKSRTNAKNYCTWEDPTFVSLLDLARETQDAHMRTELLEQAEELLADQVPIFRYTIGAIQVLPILAFETSKQPLVAASLFERCWIDPRKDENKEALS